MEAFLRIKEVRFEKNISQKELARRAEISQSYLSELEHNKKSPTLRQLCKIAEVLEMEPGDLVYYL